eukprot:scaffold1930_cov112-Isochrysis_galbana.AAC.2
MTRLPKNSLGYLLRAGRKHLTRTNFPHATLSLATRPIPPGKRRRARHRLRRGRSSLLGGYGYDTSIRVRGEELCLERGNVGVAPPTASHWALRPRPLTCRRHWPLDRLFR